VEVFCHLQRKLMVEDNGRLSAGGSLMVATGTRGLSTSVEENGKLVLPHEPRESNPRGTGSLGALGEGINCSMLLGIGHSLAFFFGGSLCFGVVSTLLGCLCVCRPRVRMVWLAPQFSDVLLLLDVVPAAVFCHQEIPRTQHCF
jgi:hypothetical protein